MREGPLRPDKAGCVRPSLNSCRQIDWRISQIASASLAWVELHRYCLSTAMAPRMIGGIARRPYYPQVAECCRIPTARSYNSQVMSRTKAAHRYKQVVRMSEHPGATANPIPDVVSLSGLRAPAKPPNDPHRKSITPPKSWAAGGINPLPGRPDRAQAFLAQRLLHFDCRR
jgi:hypothetical protein